MRQICAIGLFLWTLTGVPLLANGGRVPIFETTIITEPGSYIVTRDIVEGPQYVAITIATDNVDIDLNGFRLGAGDPAIFAENVRNITIHDGVVESDVLENAIELNNVRHFELRRLIATGSEDPCTVQVSGTGVIEHCQISNGDSSAVCAGGEGIDIRNNFIRGGPLYGPSVASVSLQGCIGCRVSGNTFAVVQDGGNAVGVDAASPGTFVLDNIARGGGISVASSGNQVLRNTVLSATTAGINVSGDRNHIEGNVLSDSGSFGLFIGGDQNVYRGNTSRGNAGAGCATDPGSADFCDAGSGNRSHGDNYMPDQR